MNSNIWIGIDFEQPDSKCLIYHEVKAKKLKGIPSFTWIQDAFGWKVAIDSDVFHPSEEIPLKIEIVLRIFLIEIFLKLFKANYVAFLVLAIAFLVLDL